jgi:hypothetical protein
MRMGDTMLAAVLGWLGTVGTFVAYAMVWRGWLTAESRPYAALNAAGGLMAGTACLIYGAWPSAASNLAWAALGVHSMVGIYRRRRLELQVNEVPGSASVTSAPTPHTGAVPVQAMAMPHRNPGCAVPQLP